MSAAIDDLPQIPKPRIVLRVGFAGKRDLHPEHMDESEPLSEAALRRDRNLSMQLGQVLSCIGRQLTALSPAPACRGSKTPEISKYYDARPPLLRLITGLCEGADTLAYGALEGVKAHEGLTPSSLDTENALVIAYELPTYRSTRRKWFLTEFDRQVQGSSYLVQSDGIYQSGDVGSPQRSRAYRSQSDLLLRQSDMLLVLADPTDPAKAGGTLETLRKALSFQLPVILINPGNNPESARIRVISPSENLADEIEDGADTDWRNELERCVRRIVADPRLAEDAFQDEQSSHGRDLLDEFFSGKSPEPLSYDSGPTWLAFEKWFKPKTPSTSSLSSSPTPSEPPKCEEFIRYRRRAAALGTCYSRRYRNAFFRNALYALLAILLAAGSLLLLVLCENHPSKPAISALILLAVVKLVLVVTIYRTAHQAIHHHWNDRAVDYRYLAERLRAMEYLPAAGIWQPPAAVTPQYASRVVRQSAADWLLEAIMRQTSPGGWADKDHIVRLDPTTALENVKARWLTEQLAYHKDTALKMQHMELWLRSLGELLNFAVLFIVAFDIGLLAFKAFGMLHPFLKMATPWIVYTTAVIPAAVAAVNVIRFQSECERLAKRSSVIVRLLGGRSNNSAKKEPEVHPASSGFGASRNQLMRLITELWKKVLIVAHPAGQDHPDTAQAETSTEGGKRHEAHALQELLQSPEEKQLGSAAGKVLHFTEGCAGIFIQEVAEWSVLYAKELVEP